MNSCEFSESTYAFTLSREIIESPNIATIGCPISPSTVEEGQNGVGYDVMFPAKPFPLFLQYKIPELMLRTSKYSPPDVFSTPHYRIALRTKKPNQHRLLLRLEENVNDVYYAAPVFHTRIRLNMLFDGKRIITNSAFFRPSDIGELDQCRHHVFYKEETMESWSCSEAHIMEAVPFHSILDKKLSEAKKLAPETFLVGLAEKLNSVADPLIILEKIPFQLDHYRTIKEKVLYLQHLCRIIFDCELLILGARSEDGQDDGLRPAT